MLPAVGLISAVRPTVPTRVCTAAGSRLTTGSIMPRVILHGACVPPGCRGAVGTPVRTPKLPAGFIGPFAAQPQGFWTRSQEALRREGLRRPLVFSQQPVTCVGRRDRQLKGFKSMWKSTSALRKWKKNSHSDSASPAASRNRQTAAPSGLALSISFPFLAQPQTGSKPHRLRLEPHPQATAAFDAANLRFKSIKFTKTQLRAMPLHLIPPAPSRSVG